MLRWGLLAVALSVSTSAMAKERLFACEPEWGALARELSGDAVDIYVATTAGQDPHHVEARPSLLAAARRSDMIVCTGAELEAGWLPVLLRESGNAAIQPGQPGYFMAADHVATLDVPDVLDRSQGDVHAEGNPHIHLDPHNLLLIGEALADALVHRFPSLEPEVRLNEKRFADRWQQAIRQWEADVASLRGVPVVVQHQNWRYLAAWAGIKVVAELEPKPGVPPSAWHLATVLKTLERTPAKFVMLANYEDRRGADWLSARSGLPVSVLPYTVGAEGTTNLFEWYDALVKRLLSSLDVHRG
jgi:zinc/manganese transport system substrate-binding protein